MECWVTLYMQYFSILKLNQDLGSISNSFKDVVTAPGTILKISGAQWHISVGASEKNHEPLCQFFRNSMDKYLALKPEAALRYFVQRIKGFCGARRTYTFTPNI